MEQVSPGLAVLIAGLGAMKITELTKEMLPWPMQPWTKSFISILMAGVLVALVEQDNNQQGVLMMFGAAGVAGLSHEIADMLSLATDFLKQQVILRSAGRRRQ